MENKTKGLFASVIAAFTAMSLNVGPVVAINIIYERFFENRITTYDPLYYKIEDFPSLRRDRHVFKTNNERNLVGYMYYYPSVEQKAVVVLSHGYGGGGQRTYMDCTNYLCAHGFYVFAYDATGNDESEGTGIGGFPQGIIDVNHAIDYVKTLEKYNKYPLVLFGHSWGGYSTTNALYYHPEVKAVVSLAGFNNSTQMIRDHGYLYSGATVDTVAPVINNHEQELFGPYANSTAMRGFENSTAGVFIVQSKDDATIMPSTGYDIYYEKYKNDPRFTFVLYEDRGHGTVYFDDASVKYTKHFNKKWEAFLKNKPSEEDKLAFIKSNIDRDIWNDRIDKELFKRIVDFYDEYIKK